MGLYPPLETTWESHRLQHVAEVRSRLEKERDCRASLYKKYRRGASVVDGLDTGLSVASAAMAATGVGLLTTIITAPVAIGLQAGAIACGLLGVDGRFICRKLEAKARKYDQLLVLAVSKLNSIAGRISAALTDDKISEEEFRLILSEVDKYGQMKAEIRRGRQKEGGGLSEAEKKQLMNLMRDEAMLTVRTKLLEELRAVETVAPLDKYILFAGLKKKSAGWFGPFELVHTQTHLWSHPHSLRWFPLPPVHPVLHTLTSAFSSGKL